MPKTCGTCTKCCEGWLQANIDGQIIYPGNPCFFIEIGKGCKKYETRPEDPCKTFNCAWIVLDDMPEEFKPEISGVIMRYSNDFFIINKAPENPTPQYLSWAITYARSMSKNILWYIDDKSYWLGDDEFCRKMKEGHSG